MFVSGLVDEAAEFRASPPHAKEQRQGIFQAMGLRELGPVLDHPGDPQARALALDAVVLHHRQYVQSQLKWIRAKVLPRSTPVYALDATAPERWNDDVLTPALLVARAFVAGSPLPANAPPLANTQPPAPGDSLTSRTCDVCEGVTVIGQVTWAAHERSKGHRARVKRAREAAAEAAPDAASSSAKRADAAMD